jgi:acetyl-CoA carboxylase carboxyl transferase subunit alpha
VVIGEGGSGGALALAVADRVLMFEHAIYSVISPEGCAAILWRSADHRGKAAEALRLTSDDLLGMGIVDGIIPEPVGGAHSNWDLAAVTLRDTLIQAVATLEAQDPATRRASRWERYESIGSWQKVDS